MTTNILLGGVGGQGTLLASNLLADAAMHAGLDVKKSEVHGMAQRGGSVISHVRFGQAIHSPLIRKGEADVLLAFEELEALRWAPFMRPGGMILVNNQRIIPMSVSAGESVYPSDVPQRLTEAGFQVIVIDAIETAKQIGNPKCLNVVLLGVLAKKLPTITPEVWPTCLRNRLPPKLLDLNLRAFEAGWQLN